jgi:hypothetical protein
MVGKAGSAQSDFVVTVMGRTLPKTLGLKLQSRSVEVLIADTFTALSVRRTKLVSELFASTAYSTRSSAS